MASTCAEGHHQAHQAHQQHHQGEHLGHGGDPGTTWNTVSRVSSSVSSLGWSTARQPWGCTSRLGTAAASTPAPQDRDSLMEDTLYTINMAHTIYTIIMLASTTTTSGSMSPARSCFPCRNSASSPRSRC